MAEKIDVSGVSIRTSLKMEKLAPINAGIWHNYYLYTGEKTGRARVELE